ncbi:MAG: magnesium transporter [Candidatus Omnitrophota bacterium]
MLDTNLIAKVEEFIQNKRFVDLKNSIPEHPEDIASLISNINNSSWRLFIFRMIPSDKAVDVFEYLSVEEEENMLKSLSSSEIRNILNEMSFDDRTELFEEMPAELVKRCINFLSPEERKVALEILNYPEDSVGRLITPDFVQLYEDMTIVAALDHIRAVGFKQETIYHCYVLDREKRLKGVVSLKKIVLAKPESVIKDIIYEKEVIKVNVFTDKEVAANIFKKYDLITLPVVDNNEKLLGIVTFDDFVDVLEDEATEDFEKIAAVLPVDKPYMEANIFSLIWKRSFWLIVLVVFESVSAIVMQNHHDTIRRLAALTFFIPVLIAMGGNTGTQSATLVIRSMATGDIRVKDFFRVIFRESFIGLFIGVTLALVGGLIVSFIQKDWLLSVAVGISMGLTIVLATTVGAGLPIIFRKLKLDPALMSGPMIATIVDVVGILLYFQIARAILKL